MLQITSDSLPNYSAVQVDKLCETKGMDYIDREKAKYVLTYIRSATHLTGCWKLSSYGICSPDEKLILLMLIMVLSWP